MELSELRSELAKVALSLVPPLIRKSLIEQREFREEFQLQNDGVLAFGNSNIAIRSSDFFNAVRSLFADSSSEIKLKDSDEEECVVRLEIEGEGLPVLSLSKGEKRLLLPGFAVFSPERGMRLRSLNEAASDVNLPDDAHERWRCILSERPLENDEVDVFFSDLRETPVSVARAILSQIERGKGSLSSLVPSSRRYYERLVGVYDGSESIGNYASGGVRKLFENLSKWSMNDAFLPALLLSSHVALTENVAFEHLEEEALVRIFGFLEKNGDKLSQLGAIEAGFRAISHKRVIEPLLTRLVEQIRDDEPEEPTSGFKLLSALFVMVDGQLAKLRVFAAEPPFYRRLASLAQAALICSQLLSSGVETDKFLEQIEGVSTMEFYFQSLVDMRLETRWVPELISSSQIKAYFLKRIMTAARKHEKNIKSVELRTLIFGKEPENPFLPFKNSNYGLPGPLEAAESAPEPPSELLEIIEAQLAAGTAEPSSFVPLVNSALFYHIDQTKAERIANIIRKTDYQLENIKSKEELFALLNGLATVAAATRSRELADELRVLIRRNRHSARRLPAQEVVRICLAAAASRREFNDWRDFVGDWFTELAFDSLEDSEGVELLSDLRCLCHLVPGLWIPCGRADAALKAYIGAFHQR